MATKSRIFKKDLHDVITQTRLFLSPFLMLGLNSHHQLVLLQPIRWSPNTIPGFILAVGGDVASRRFAGLPRTPDD